MKWPDQKIISLRKITIAVTMMVYNHLEDILHKKRLKIGCRLFVFRRISKVGLGGFSCVIDWEKPKREKSLSFLLPLPLSPIICDVLVIGESCAHLT